MKKINTFLTVLTLSLSVLSTILTPSIVSASTQVNQAQAPNTYEMVCRVSNSSYSFTQNIYKTTIIDEDENAFNVLSDSNLTGQWLNVYASNNNTPDNKQDDLINDFELLQDTQSNTYQYYGIVNGNGHTTTIYIKVNDSYQSYTIQSDYIGFSCKLINIDRLITSDNYKDIVIQGTEEPANNTMTNDTINAWNERSL